MVHREYCSLTTQKPYLMRNQDNQMMPWEKDDSPFLQFSAKVHFSSAQFSSSELFKNIIVTAALTTWHTQQPCINNTQPIGNHRPSGYQHSNIPTEHSVGIWLCIRICDCHVLSIILLGYIFVVQIRIFIYTYNYPTQCGHVDSRVGKTASLLVT